jgi:hypothetical protein
MATPIRPFNAINGEELKKLILNDVTKILAADPLYAKESSYVEATYRYNITVDAYPMEPPSFSIAPNPKTVRSMNGDQLRSVLVTDITNQINADARFRHHLSYPQVAFRWKTAVDAVEAGPTIQIDNAGGMDVTAPAQGGVTADAARRDAGLGVPVPTSVKGPSGDRVTVDQVPVGPRGATTSGTAPADDEARSVTTNVPEHGRVFARSATIKTNANPTGVEVDGPAGSKPDMERVQEILQKEDADAAIDRTTPDPAA